jgi:hypothetical protein
MHFTRALLLYRQPWVHPLQASQDVESSTSVDSVSIPRSSRRHFELRRKNVKQHGERFFCSHSKCVFSRWITQEPLTSSPQTAHRRALIEFDPCNSLYASLALIARDCCH